MDKKYREIEERLLEETKDLSYNSDSEDYFELIDIENGYDLNGTYIIPTDVHTF